VEVGREKSQRRRGGTAGAVETVQGGLFPWQRERGRGVCAGNLNDPGHRDEIFRMAGQMEGIDRMWRDQAVRGVSGGVTMDDRGLEIHGRVHGGADE